MSEMSDMFKLVNAMELAKTARVGMGLTYFDVIELVGELKSLKFRIAELESENGRLQESWLWETVCPDGSLRPKVSELLLNLNGWKERSNGWESIVETLNTRIAELEEEQVILKDQMREAKNILIDKNLHIDSLYEEGYKLQQRIAELERDFDMLFRSSANKQPRKNTQSSTIVYGKEREDSE